MPKVRLYNRDVRFHSGNAMNPLQFTAAAYNGHTAWARITPMVWFKVDTLASDFDGFARRFAALGLTGTLGETGTSSWSFGGVTAQNIGRAVAYITDMYRAYYARRGVTHDGRYAWWPQNAGYAAAGNIEANRYALFPLISGDVVHGSTADSLQLYTWTGSTASQAAVLADAWYVSAGLSAFGSWVQQVAQGLSGALQSRPGISAPALIAGENERHLASNNPFFNNGDSNQEMGSWIQAINDPRARTHLFFGRHTLFDLWGATGASAQSFRSPHQRTMAYTITACDGSGAITVTGTNVDIIWSERFNFINYTPGWYNFITSFTRRERQHLLNTAWQQFKQVFPQTLIGNYQDVPSTRRYPDPSVGKIANYMYSCDISCTGPGSENGFNNSSVTGTFAFDYANPDVYVKSGDSQARGWSNWLPGYGTVASSPIYRNYSGAWGTSALTRIGTNSGLLSRGDLNGSYPNFLQHCSKHGLTSIAGGGTAEGFTGGNILDLRNLWLQIARNQIDSARYSLDSFTDNASKPVIPWLGAFQNVYPSIFSLTASPGTTTTVWPDVNGLTNYTASVYSPVYLDYNTNLVKYCIQQHNIQEFYIFDYAGLDGLTVGMQGLDFWNNMIDNLLLDSNTAPVARISVSPSNNVRDNDGNGSATLIASGLSSSDAQNDTLTYAWTTSNGLIATGATASFVFAVGNHTINLVVSDTYGATGGTSASVSVQPNSVPFADFSAVPGFQATDNDDNGSETFVLDASNSTDSNGGSILQYNWLFDGSIAASGITTSVAFTVAGSPHTARLNVVDDGGASASREYQITVLPKPAPSRGPGAANNTSMMMFAGKIYTRNEFDNLLRAFYPNLLR